MGCKQTTVKSPAIIFPSSSLPTKPTPPVYVKSALKKDRTKGKRKIERLSLSKRKQKSTNKSVIFNERVQVKLRTPTPKQTRYEHVLISKTDKDDDDDDDDDDEYDDDQVSIISSHEEFRNEQTKTSTNTNNSLIQRNQPNGFRYKNNSISVLPSPKPQSVGPSTATVLNANIYPNAEPTILPGNRFRIRRKVLQTATTNTTEQTSDSADVIQPPVIQSPVIPIQRPLPNTSAILIEHPVSYTNDNTSAQTAYYGFKQRSGKNVHSKKKK